VKGSEHANSTPSHAASVSEPDLSILNQRNTVTIIICVILTLSSLCLKESQVKHTRHGLPQSQIRPTLNENSTKKTVKCLCVFYVPLHKLRICMKLHLCLHYTLKIIMEAFPFLPFMKMSILDSCCPVKLPVMMECSRSVLSIQWPSAIGGHRVLETWLVQLRN